MSAVRLAPSAGFEGAAYICALPDKALSAEAIKAAQTLAALLGETPSPEPAGTDHCAECVVTYFTILTPIIGQTMPSQRAALSFKARPNPAQFSRKAQGPPLGGRAPPAYI